MDTFPRVAHLWPDDCRGGQKRYGGFLAMGSAIPVSLAWPRLALALHHRSRDDRQPPQRPGLLRSRATGCTVTRGAATRKPCFNQRLVVRAKFARRETKGQLRDDAAIHALADRGRTDLKATTQFLQRINLALERNHDVDAAVFPGRPVVRHVVSLFGGARGRREIGAGGRAPLMAGSGNRSRVNRRLTDRTFCQDFATFIRDRSSPVTASNGSTATSGTMYVRDGWPKERVTNVLVVVSDEAAGHLTRIPTDHEELEEIPLAPVRRPGRSPTATSP